MTDVEAVLRVKIALRWLEGSEGVTLDYFVPIAQRAELILALQKLGLWAPLKT